MSQEDVKKVLEEVDKAAEDARWISMDNAPPGAKGFSATVGAWRLLVVSWETGRGSGYDGTAASDKGLILRLTRELAEKFYKQAESQKGIPR